MAIARAAFAEECVRQGVYFRIEPHYLMGVAQLRSSISDGNSVNQFGPYQLTQAEWDANCQNDEFDVHFTATEINSWRRQCVVFGLMAHRAFDAFVAANSRNPSALELYLQQWAGATTAANLQTALDATAALVEPAAKAVLDVPESVSPIEKSDQPTNGPLKRLSPDVVSPVAGGPGLLTLAMLQKHWNHAPPALIQGMANTAGVLDSLGINTPLRMAHFMAQITAESGGGTQMVEKLNYSAGRMMTVFPRRFPDLASTAGFANNELAFGNKVYNGRMGNRLGSNDGFNFRGRGCLQVTGRDNYTAIGISCQLPLVDNPDLAIDPRHALLIAGTEFVKLGCLQECDRDDVVQVSARINLGHRTTPDGRGINGLPERRKQLPIWKREFGVP